MNISSTLRFAMAAAVLSGSVFAAAATAQTPGIMYFRTFYSDATLTTQVGFYRDRCSGNRVVASPVHGVTSPFYTLEPIGSCPGGYW